MTDPTELATLSGDAQEWTLEELEGALLPAHAREKGGRDTIFAWLAHYQQAKATGQDAINGTVGSLLEDDGTLAVNPVVSSTLREQADLELSAYAPLPGLPHFRTLVQELALGDGLPIMQHHGIHTEALITPGGTGALYQSARNLLTSGTTLLLRDRHWGPYQTIAKECGLLTATWPLTPSSGDDQIDVEALDGVLKQLLNEQNHVLSWLNDPAHNPTGMSLTAESRMIVLERFANSALANPSKGVTLFIDGAYAAYAKDHHGWGDTLALFASEALWPSNLFVCFGFSASKSHTLYGQRCGALVMLHPSREFLDRMLEVMLHTGRGTWSGAARLPQATVHTIHSNVDKFVDWLHERDLLQQMLERRREIFNHRCAKEGVPLLPSHDGYFAFLPHENPGPIAEASATRGLYVVPLEGGIRIGLCSIPTQDVDRAAAILAEAWRHGA
ncbi:MAG: aminotransferase class I/II-fold pyridoxal phosphate-dependent enzyme [Candidatus Thalassarchaeaceae archaeon]|jgi:aromatic-amino-acid transaminase|nr:aminotransferase class I/II-fold pyridoxal phosphate-dependent enzyme [Candidatus Thalassarchaeaceae archaeon]